MVEKPETQGMVIDRRMLSKVDIPRIALGQGFPPVRPRPHNHLDWLRFEILKADKIIQR